MCQLILFSDGGLRLTGCGFKAKKMNLDEAVIVFHANDGNLAAVTESGRVSYMGLLPDT